VPSLPQDPALLLGPPRSCTQQQDGQQQPGSSGPDASQQPPLPEPAWVHGDLTAENLLLQRPPVSQAAEGAATADSGVRSSCDSVDRGCRAVLIDFADGGQGDPLWDLAALYIRSFRQVAVGVGGSVLHMLAGLTILVKQHGASPSLCSALL